MSTCKKLIKKLLTRYYRFQVTRYYCRLEYAIFQLGMKETCSIWYPRIYYQCLLGLHERYFGYAYAFPEIVLRQYKRLEVRFNEATTADTETDYWCLMQDFSDSSGWVFSMVVGLA